MSFILDQLKRSGRQRALELAMRKKTAMQEAGTDGPLLQRPEERTPLRVKKWYVAGAAVLLGAIALYGVTVFFRGPSLVTQPAVPAAKGLVQETLQLSAIPSSPGPLVRTPEAPVQAETVSDGKSSKAGQAKSSAGKASKPQSPPDDHLAVPQQAAAERSAKEDKRPPGRSDDAPIMAEPSESFVRSPVPEIRQLPHAVRKSLPEIRVTSHLYRKDSRLVSINGRIMSEGYNLDDGLFLEEITPEGVVLSYGKHRFFVRPDR